MKTFMEYFENQINESQAADIKWALKDIEAFNKGKRGYDDLERTAEDIVKNLGFKPTSSNIENTVDHLSMSMSMTGGERIPKDKDIVKELYGILR